MGAAIGAGKGVAAATFDLASTFRAPATRHLLAEAALEDFEEQATVHADRFAEAERRLREAGIDEDLRTATYARFQEVAKGWAKAADGRKQRILMAALLHSFDPEAYREGNARRILATIGELDYPEVRWLSVTFGDHERLADAEKDLGHARDRSQLETLYGEDTEHGEMLRRAVDLRLVAQSNGLTYSTRIAWLGREVLKYCCDPDLLREMGAE